MTFRFVETAIRQQTVRTPREKRLIGLVGCAANPVLFSGAGVGATCTLVCNEKGSRDSLFFTSLAIGTRCCSVAIRRLHHLSKILNEYSRHL